MAYDISCEDAAGDLTFGEFQTLSAMGRDWYLYQALQEVAENTGEVPVVTTQAPTRFRTTESAVLPPGSYRSVTFYSVSTNTTNPTVLGVALEPGRSVTFTADVNRSLAAMAYTAAATAVLEVNSVAI